jgi:catechol 2,3-dioxygenase
MGLPPTSRNPAFRITRISHVVLSVTNLERSLDFYTNLIGLVVTETDDDVAYLRGVEESAHHSVVLRRSEHAHAERLGFRVATEDDLDAARVHFEQRGLTAHWADAPHQGRTLHATDIGGVAIELCVTMPTRPRRTLDFADFRGAAATRIDHAQVHVTDPGTYAAFYTELGFRISEYATASGTPSDPLMGVFLARKGDMLDLVALVNRGPRLHHVAFTVHDASVTLPAVCDRAASLGLRDQIAYGPGRHGLAPQQFLYLLDPDGHRVELVSHAYQLLDPEIEPVGWALDDPRGVTQWGPDPPASWWEQASPFRGVEVRTPPGAD